MPRNVTLCTESRACTGSVPLLDRDAETLTERPEFLVESVEVLTDVGEQFGGVVELAVAVAGIVLEVGAHLRLRLGAQCPAAELVVTADGAHRVGQKVGV